MIFIPPELITLSIRPNQRKDVSSTNSTKSPVTIGFGLIIGAKMTKQLRSSVSNCIPSNAWNTSDLFGPFNGLIATWVRVSVIPYVSLTWVEIPCIFSTNFGFTFPPPTRSVFIFSIWSNDFSNCIGTMAAKSIGSSIFFNGLENGSTTFRSNPNFNARTTIIFPATYFIGMQSKAVSPSFNPKVFPVS